MKTIRLAAAAALLLLLLAGCGQGAGDGQEPDSGPAAGRATADDDAQAPSNQEQSTTAQSSNSATERELGTVTGTRMLTSSSKPQHKMRLDLRGLHPDGKLTRLDFTVTNLSAARLFGADFLSLLGNDALYLVDTDGLKRYMVVKDSAGQSLLTPANLYLAEGDVFEGTAYFAPLPDDVDRIDVVFEDVGRFPTPVE